MTLPSSAANPVIPRYSRGRLLDSSPEALGELLESDAQELSDADLRQRLERHGYLYLPGFFPRRAVLEVRGEIVYLMDELGVLDPARDPLDAVPHPALDLTLRKERGSASLDSVGRDCLSMHDLLYGAQSMRLFERLLQGPAMHFDLTWFRAAAPGIGTVPHCDVVYMGRGTQQLYTLWVPYSDISLEQGGLMVLEDSMSPEVTHKLRRYLCRDVDEYCSNRPLPSHVDLDSRTDNKVWKGWLAENPVSLRRNLGGRWLSAEYRMGDALLFSIRLVHGALDNRGSTFRLSSDARFQPADEPADERFVGPGPYGHIGKAKRGRIC